MKWRWYTTWWLLPCVPSPSDHHDLSFLPFGLSSSSVFPPHFSPRFLFSSSSSSRYTNTGRPLCIVRRSAVWFFRPTHLVSSLSNPPRSLQGRRSSDGSLRPCRRIAADRSPSHQDSFELPGWLAGWLVGQHPPFRRHWLNTAAWRRRACHRTLRFLLVNVPPPFRLPAPTREEYNFS